MISPISQKFNGIKMSTSPKSKKFSSPSNSLMQTSSVNFTGKANAVVSVFKRVFEEFFGSTVKEIGINSIKKTKFDGNSVKKWEKVIKPNGDFTKTTFEKNDFTRISEYKAFGDIRLPKVLAKTTFLKDGNLFSVTDYSGKEFVTCHYSQKDGRLMWKQTNKDVVVYNKEGKEIPDPFTEYLNGKIS